MITRDDILGQAYKECLNEMFKWAQPSIDLNELLKNGYKDDKKAPLYSKHYLSNENFKQILNFYMSAYGITDDWDNTFETLIKQLLEGGVEDDYKPHTDERPGYRDYKKVAPLKEVLVNSKDVDTVIEYIKKCQNFFKGHSQEADKFNFSVCLGYSPTSDLSRVEKYWQNNGRPDFKIKEFDILDIIYGGPNDEYIDITEDEFINTLK